MTAFVFGYLLGLLTALGIAGLLCWWIGRRANKEALAKFLHGMALVLNYKPKPPLEIAGEQLKSPVESLNGKQSKEQRK